LQSFYLLLQIGYGFFRQIMMVVYAMATDAVVFGILVDSLPALLFADAGFDPP